MEYVTFLYPDGYEATIGPQPFNTKESLDREIDEYLATCYPRNGTVPYAIEISPELFTRVRQWSDEMVEFWFKGQKAEAESKRGKWFSFWGLLDIIVKES